MRVEAGGGVSAKAGQMKADGQAGIGQAVVVEVEVVASGQHPVGRQGDAAAFVVEAAGGDGQRADRVERGRSALGVDTVGRRIGWQPGFAPGHDGVRRWHG